MSMTDPIADMLTRLRNANSAFHDSVSMPYSKLKANIAGILEREGYIAGFDVEEAKVGKTLTLNLKFGSNRERALAGVRRGGLGVAILSTSSGLLTDREAKDKGVGGEVLAYVW